jgi:hypothetical protein
VTSTSTQTEHRGFATTGSAYYPVLVAVFTGLVLISNVTATKGVAFGPIIGDWSLILDGAFICFPLTYVIGDVLSEVYGFKAARRAIFLGFAMAVLAVLMFWLAIEMPPLDPDYQTHFESVLGLFPRLLIAGLAGFIVGQTLNAWVVVRVDRRRRVRRHAGVLQHRRRRDRHQHVARLRYVPRDRLDLQDRGRGGRVAGDLPGNRVHQAPRTHVRARSLSLR